MEYTDFGYSQANLLLTVKKGDAGNLHHFTVSRDL